ncbi:cytochrome P450 [Nocardia bovistercoris]|uniref:Cytochrome P450 n=1 Tax=Nocardia bovistercoris TaxID=2785916 RepID=A0A931IC76_9NOCA|nr:cytochrome P450 [Nocardia bovistercoris]MBH0777871.1 cytochrome P450 [Nocardia bovistercoris]
MTISHPPTSARPYHRLDISSQEFWGQDFLTREHSFAQLRAEPGLTWHDPAPSMFPHEEAGYWAVTRHADIRHISRNSELFCSSQGISMAPLAAEFQRVTTFFLTMDPPEHTRYRKLISMAFTPRQIRLIESQIRDTAAQVVDEVIAELEANGEADFAASVSKKLPMRTISRMIGLDPADYEAVADAAEAVFGTSDGEYASIEEQATHLMTQLGVLQNAGIDLARRRREEPADDLMTNMVNAEVDGHGLTDADIGAFMVLLAAAGNDTTKQTISHVFKALAEHPEQAAWLAEDFDGRIGAAIDEFVRWATPVMTFARHATADTEVAGTPIKAGEKLVLFYCSGNRDDAAFERPHEFDITRGPTEHVAFGGGGTHFCLGAQLARMELRHMFHQLSTRLPAVDVGRPEYVNSNIIHGMKRMPIRLRSA